MVTLARDVSCCHTSTNSLRCWRFRDRSFSRSERTFSYQHQSLPGVMSATAHLAFDDFVIGQFLVGLELATLTVNICQPALYPLFIKWTSIVGQLRPEGGRKREGEGRERGREGERGGEREGRERKGGGRERKGREWVHLTSSYLHVHVSTWVYTIHRRGYTYMYYSQASDGVQCRWRLWSFKNACNSQYVQVQANICVHTCTYMYLYERQYVRQAWQLLFAHEQLDGDVGAVL